MAFNRETTVYTGPFQDQVNTGIIKLDTDLTNAFTFLNQLLSSLAGKVNTTEKGVASGICPLDTSAKIATGYLPTIPVSLIPTTVGQPVGGLMPWPTDVAPENYLPCEGGYYSTTTYAALYAVIGTRYGAGAGAFRVPDYRGYFLRGWSHGSGVDPDASSRTNRGDGTSGDNIGTVQTSALKDHIHRIWQTGGAQGSGPGVGTYTSYQGVTGQTDYLMNGTSPTGSISDTSTSETRALNKSVLWVIKYQ